jgi:hypothetical protein
MRCIQAKNKTPLPTAPPPTFANPGHEDASEFINLEPFCQAAREAKTDIIFSGTDYGVRTMSTTVAMTMDRFEQHWNLYNRFAALSIEEVEDVGDDDENGLLSTFACGRLGYSILTIIIRCFNRQTFSL